MDAIAREASVSKATLYAHYKGKDELFAEMIAMGTAEHSAALTDLDHDGPDIRAQLLRIAGNHVDLLLSPQGLGMYRVVLAEAPRFPELGRAFFANGPAVKCGALADYLKNADQRGLLKIDDASLAACELIALAGGVLHLRAMLGLAHEISAKEQEAVIEHGVDAFLRAYRA
jgi:TetR/AcrR family transcriptional regulator, mexJK operon transcriptional repressor